MRRIIALEKFTRTPVIFYNMKKNLQFIWHYLMIKKDILVVRSLDTSSFVFYVNLGVWFLLENF